MNVYPVAISVVIVAAIAFVGALIAYFRDRKKYLGHEEYAADARMLAKKLGGEVFRDGNDLVINGAQKNLSTIIRLSYAENTPGLNIRMNAPANITLTVAPRGGKAVEGRVLVRTMDEAFDTRFTTRADNAIQARMFLGSKSVMSELNKLCCSKAYLTINPGIIEQSEPLIPVPKTGKHIAAHLDSMTALAHELERMPLADKVVIPRVKRNRGLVLKASLVVGMIAAAVGIITAAREPAEVPLPAVGSDIRMPAGVLPNEGMLIGGLSGWRLATPETMDGDALAWASSYGQREVGRVVGEFTGHGKVPDVAYLLMDDRGQKRLVVLAEGRPQYDVKYDYVGVLVRIPKADISQIQWASRKPEDPDGDALLLTRKPQDRNSGLVLYFSDGKLVSGVPSDYQSISLTE